MNEEDEGAQTCYVLLIELRILLLNIDCIYVLESIQSTKTATMIIFFFPLFFWVSSKDPLTCWHRMTKYEALTLIGFLVLARWERPFK